MERNQIPSGEGLATARRLLLYFSSFCIGKHTIVFLSSYPPQRKPISLLLVIQAGMSSVKSGRSAFLLEQIQEYDSIFTGVETDEKEEIKWSADPADSSLCYIHSQ